jgi:hypothetical protein
MKRLKPCVLLLIFFFSCTKTPEGIIPKDQMIRVLTDVHLANSLAAYYGNLDTMRQRTSTYLNAVYQKHEIDSAKFNRSLKYYSENPEILNEIYDQVDKILVKMTDSLTKIEELENKRIAAAQRKAEKRKVQLMQDSLIRITNKGKKDTIILLKPAIPAIWPFKEYQYHVKKSPAKTSRGMSIKKK